MGLPAWMIGERMPNSFVMRVCVGGNVPSAGGRQKRSM